MYTQHDRELVHALVEDRYNALSYWAGLGSSGHWHFNYYKDDLLYHEKLLMQLDCAAKLGDVTETVMLSFDDMKYLTIDIQQVMDEYENRPGQMKPY